MESSTAWNNAGTGHAAQLRTELHAAARRTAASTSPKALEVNTEFDLSRQLWAYLVTQGCDRRPERFIHPVPAHELRLGRRRTWPFSRPLQGACRANHCYRGMEYSERHAQIGEWTPLIMEGRDRGPAGGGDAHRDRHGRRLRRAHPPALRSPREAARRHAALSQSRRGPDARGRTAAGASTSKDEATGAATRDRAKFVFIGAGGGALPLLQKSGIPEGRGYGGFPVSGIWLRCDAERSPSATTPRSMARPALGAPPMSVPHLDTRLIDGKTSLLFGPYAGFTTRFLKHGRIIDLFRSIEPSNILPMLAVARDNVGPHRISDRPGAAERAAPVRRLQNIYAHRRSNDWQLAVAGRAGAGHQAGRGHKGGSNSAPSWSRPRTVHSSRCSARRLARPRRPSLGWAC